MTYRDVFKLADNKLVIKLPSSFRDKQVLVTIDDMPDTEKNKMELMRKAVADPMYISDMMEVNEDFDGIEHETL